MLVAICWHCGTRIYPIPQGWRLIPCRGCGKDTSRGGSTEPPSTLSVDTPDDSDTDEWIPDEPIPDSIIED